MNVIKYPQKEEWDELLKRPVMNVDTLRETVCRVLDDVKTGGDRTVMAYENSSTMWNWSVWPSRKKKWTRLNV